MFSLFKLLGLLILKIVLMMGVVALLALSEMAVVNNAPASPVVITCIVFVLLADLCFHLSTEISKVVQFRLSRISPDEYKKINFAPGSEEVEKIRSLAERVKEDTK